MKNKKIFIWIFIIFLIVGLAAIGYFFIWPKITGEKVLNNVNQFIKSDEFLKSNNDLENVILYTNSFILENNYKIDENYQKELKSLACLKKEALELLDYHLDYLILVQNNKDTNKFLSSANKEITKQIKEYKEVLKVSNSKRNNVINYSGEMAVVLRIADIRVNEYISSLKNEIVNLNVIKNTVINLLYQTIGKDALGNTFTNFVNNSSVLISSNIVSKIKDENFYTDNTNLINIYNEIFYKHFSKNFDYSSYVDNDVYLQLIDLSKKIDLELFYKNFATDNFQTFLNATDLAKQPDIIKFNDLLMSLLEV